MEDSQYVLSRSTKNEALIIGLQPNTYYYVRVMAYNSAGEKRKRKVILLLKLINNFRSGA